MVQWRASCPVLTVKLDWVSSIGQASNAVVGAGSPQPFRSIKAEWTSAVSKICQKKHLSRKVSYKSCNDRSAQYLSSNKFRNSDTAKTR